MASKNITLTIKNVRLSFAHLFQPQEQENDDGEKRYTYNASCLIPKKLSDGSANPQVKEIVDAMKSAVEATWPGQKKVIPSERRCFRDGEPIDPDTVDESVAGSGTRVPLYDGYAGHYYLSTNRGVKAKDSPNPLQLLGPKKTAKDANGKPCFPTLTEADGMLYSGCYADVIVNIYGYDGKGKNPDRINASLEAVKFRAHGEAFGAKPVDANSLFDEEEDDDFDTGGSAAEDDDLMS